MRLRAGLPHWAWGALSSAGRRTSGLHKGWMASMLRLDRGEEAALLAEARRQIERCGLGPYADVPAASPLALGQQRIVKFGPWPVSQRPLLLDEPAAGLRHLEKQALANLLRQLRAEGLAFWWWSTIWSL